MAAVMHGVTVEAIRNTNVVYVQVEIVICAWRRILQTASLPRSVKWHSERRVTSDEEALSWLNAQVAQLQAKVNESEQVLQRYAEKTGLAETDFLLQKG